MQEMITWKPNKHKINQGGGKLYLKNICNTGTIDMENRLSQQLEKEPNSSQFGIVTVKYPTKLAHVSTSFERKNN